MKILLINPSGGYQHEFPSLGLLSIAASLQESGNNVSFYDEGARHREGISLIDHAKAFTPDVIGVALYTTNIRQSFETIARLRLLFRNCTIIVGGPHATVLPERTMKECSDIDYLVCGEGEISARELVESLSGGRDQAQVRGIYYRDGDRIVKNAQREWIPDLDAIPTPAYDLLEPFSYPYDVFRVGKKVATIMSSRGCPYDCIFCAAKAVWGKSFRRRSPDHVAAEINLLVHTYGYDEIYFMDDLFAVNRKWLEEFYEALKNYSIKVPWKCLGRVDLLSLADYHNMADNGCYMIQFGVESGDDEILNDINKGITTDQVRKAFAEAKHAKLNTYGFFIVGHQKDTRETILKTIYFARRLKPDFVSFFASVPFPGTKLHDLLPEEVKYDWDQIRYSGFWRKRSPLQLSSVNPDDLQQFELQAHTAIYARFSYLWQIMTEPRCRAMVGRRLRLFLQHTRQRIRLMLMGEWILDKYRDLDLAGTLRSKAFESIWKDFVGSADIESEISRRSVQRHALYRLLRKSILMARARSVLEVGCGTAIESHHLSRQYPDVKFVASDLSSDAVKVAQRIGAKIGSQTTVIRDNVESLQFGSESFDVVFSQGLMEHFRDPLPALGEQVRVLRTNGLLIVDVPQKYNPYTVYKHRRMREGIWEYGWETEYSFADLKRLAQAAGLSVVDVGSYGYGRSQDYGFSLLPRVLQRCAEGKVPVISHGGKIGMRLLGLIEKQWGHYFLQNIIVVMKKL